MSLAMSKTYKGLGVTMKVGGFEAFDLIFCLIIAAISSIIFGGSNLGSLMVILLPSVMLTTLHFGKRGKPEGYLMHLLKYLISHGQFLAAEDSKYEAKLRELIYE